MGLAIAQCRLLPPVGLGTHRDPLGSPGSPGVGCQLVELGFKHMDLLLHSGQRFGGFSRMCALRLFEPRPEVRQRVEATPLLRRNRGSPRGFEATLQLGVKCLNGVDLRAIVWATVGGTDSSEQCPQHRVWQTFGQSCAGGAHKTLDVQRRELRHVAEALALAARCRQLVLGLLNITTQADVPCAEDLQSYGKIITLSVRTRDLFPRRSALRVHALQPP
mmetsp:Transcript_81305/g.226364  ORF Transcript_81305/g.226364 Transcript_81305/m.226364 type:complete len:219 (+) Transcript_81305:1021-1677(+)